MNVPITLRGCAGWSRSSLSAYPEDMFSHCMTHICEQNIVSYVRMFANSLRLAQLPPVQTTVLTQDIWTSYLSTDPKFEQVYFPTIWFSLNIFYLYKYSHNTHQHVGFRKKVKDLYMYESVSHLVCQQLAEYVASNVDSAKKGGLWGLIWVYAVYCPNTKGYCVSSLYAISIRTRVQNANTLFSPNPHPHPVSSSKLCRGILSQRL